MQPKEALQITQRRLSVWQVRKLWPRRLDTLTKAMRQAVRVSPLLLASLLSSALVLQGGRRELCSSPGRGRLGLRGVDPCRTET